MNRWIKRLLLTAIVIVCLLLLPFVLIALPPIQSFLVEQTSEWLSDRLGAEVKIKNVRLKPFNSLSVNELLARDLAGDTMIFVGSVDAEFSLYRLRDKEIVIQGISLNDSKVRFVVDEEGVINFSILQRLFKKPDEPKPFPFRVEAEYVQLYNCEFRFRDLRQQQKSEGFDPADIVLTEIGGRFRIDNISDKLYKGEVLALSLTEKSGLHLDDLRFEFEWQDSLVLARNFALSLAKSDIKADTLLVRTDEWQSTQNIGRLWAEADNFFAKISPKDLAPVLPQLQDLRSELFVALEAEGYLEDIEIGNIMADYGSQTGIYGSLNLRGLPSVDNLYILADITNLYANISQLQDDISLLSRKPFVLPRQVLNLRKVSYKGTIAGYFRDLHIKGNIATAAGSLRTDLDVAVKNSFNDMAIDGRLSTAGVDLERIMGKESGFGKIAIDAYAKLSFGKNTPLQSDVKAKIGEFTFKGYRYENIVLDGNFYNKRFEGNASIDDQNGRVDFHGLVDLNDELNKIFHFDAEVADVNLNRLNIIEKYPNLAFGFGINADFAGSNIDDVNGTIEINDIRLSNNGVYTIDRFNVSSYSDKDSLITLFESDLINGYVSGNYTIATLPADILDVIKESFPVFQSKTHKEQKQQGVEIQRNKIGFYFEVERLKEFCDVLEIPWTTTKQSTLYGFYNGSSSMFNVAADVPQLTNGSMNFTTSHLNLYKRGETVNFIASTAKQNVKDSLVMMLKSDLQGDSANVFLVWKNFDKENVYAGEFLSSIMIGRDTTDRLTLDVKILPTQMVMANNLLNIERSFIRTNFKRVDVEDFAITGSDQQIRIFGAVSPDPKESLTLDIHQLNVGEALKPLMAEDAKVSFGGIIDGSVVLSNLLKEPVMEANVYSENFIFNDTEMGQVSARSVLDRDSSCIRFAGTAIDERVSSRANLYGAFFLKRDSLHLGGRAENVRLKFIHPFIEKIFSNMDGYAVGDFNVYANTQKRRWEVEVDGDVKQGMLQVDALGANFYFNDRIRLTRDSVIFQDIDIFDKNKNRGKISGQITHKYFDDFLYKIDFSAENLLVFQKKQSEDAPFYGEAYATGSGSIIGDSHNTTEITCRASANKNTKVFIPLDNSMAVTSSNFVHFVKKKEDLENFVDMSPRAEDISNVNINLNIDVTPEAQIQLLLDRAAGDKIEAKGSGAMRIAYNTKNEDLKLYGNYAVSEGKYLFTFQQAIEREFSISEGSLVWNGNPQNPTIDLKAVYQTKASIKGLFDESVLSKSYSSSNVPVNCVLLLTGNLTQPKIAFDIELPSSDENIRRALSNIITTDEMMNRQMIYLLAFGRFYNPNSMSAENPNSQMTQTQNDVLALVTSTVGSQLNNMLSQLSDKFTVGINIKLDQDQISGMQRNEYGVNINYAPNERVIINSNLGYRNDETQEISNSALSQAILDFEFEYKLVQSGKLVAKIYNRTNSIQDFKDAPYTQGVGLIYRENFSTIKKLFRKRKKRLQAEQPAEAVPEMPKESADTTANSQKKE